MDNEDNGVAGRIADGVKGDMGDVAAETARKVVEANQDELSKVAAAAARTAVEANVDLAASKVEERYGAVLEPAAGAAEWVTGSVRARPIGALLVAAGIGCALGLLHRD
ncbi:MAG: hypothetical protein RQ966_09040 [Acetobacteraceae bacterium]|nr:hypothetical protein [Acetobacteraceae bacterium]